MFTNIKQTMGETIDGAEACVHAAVPRAAADLLRPAFHFGPPAQWMNDICGAMWHDGWYHIFYQYNPFADHCDWSCIVACWGHARSRDLVHWEQLPIALAPSLDEGNWQCVSGCATHAVDGTPVLFYGHTPLPQGELDAMAQPPRQQRAALPLDVDLRTWRTLDIGLAPDQSGVPADINSAWTDMFVFKDGERTFAIFKEAGGMVAEATAPNLTRWQIVGYMAGVEGECPNFIKLDGRWLLLRSTYPMTWQVGTFDPERVAFEMDGPSGILDYSYGLATAPDPADGNFYTDADGVPVCRYGAPPEHAHSRGFYASSTFTDPDGRTLLLAWVGAFEPQGWNCCMSLPRVLTLDKAGHLLQAPVPELKALRGAHACAGPRAVGAGAYRMDGASGAMLEVIADISLGTSPAIQLALRSAGGTAVVIDYDGHSLDANGTAMPQVLGETPGRIKLHLFYDRSVMELFVNDGRQTVTRVAYPPQGELQVEVSGEGAVLHSLDVWKINSAR